MASNNKPSTSHYKSDSSDDDDEHDQKLSSEQLSLKIKTCRNLCLGNKINVSNAFDIDMIECFYSWLEKKKSLILDGDNDVDSFQEISDYLEATAKVYSYRVDNLSETTSKLVEKFKSINNDNDDNNDHDDDYDAPKIQKSKRQKMMLTTNEKLRRRPNEFENIFNPNLVDHSISNLSCNELFYTQTPSRYFSSLYHGKSFAEEMKTFDDEKKEYDKKKENVETTEIEQSLCDMMDTFLEGSLCPEFDGFIAERDKVENSNDDELKGIEYRFDPHNNQFLEDNNSEDSNESTNNKPDNNELDTNSNDKDTTVLEGLDGLLQCIDNVDRDYSFFNPKLLANWNGPQAWKAQAMLKALKSSTPSERKDIISNINQNIDESKQNNITHSKKNNKVKNNYVEVQWLNTSQIKHFFKDKIESKEKILPRTLHKWDELDNLTDTQTVVADVKYESEFVEYVDIIPDWWTYKKNQVNNTWSEDSNSSQNIDNCGNSIAETLETKQFDNENNEHLDNKNDEEVDDKLVKLDVSGELNPEDEDALSDIKSESKMDIAVLKTEISDIIDKECVETDPNNEWSSKLSFFNLLTNLRVNERDELSIPIVFVGLLHLANERGLKLSQEHCTINNMEETFIAKPMKKK